MSAFVYKGGEWDTSCRTYIMGILNITPDSFSDGGMYTDPAAALARAVAMEQHGADCIDVGAQSTRPGHVPVTPEEEWARLCPVLEMLCGHISVPVSVDTYVPEIARRSVEYGASIINDVSGDMESGMLDVAASTGAGIISMYAGGGADDKGDKYNNFARMLDYFRRIMTAAKCMELDMHRIALDPGIGFGKSREDDLGTLVQLEKIAGEWCENAILVGCSRKRVIDSCLEVSTRPEERMPGTIALHTVAQFFGARILRVHDVAETVQAARVTDALIAAKNNV